MAYVLQVGQSQRRANAGARHGVIRGEPDGGGLRLSGARKPTGLSGYFLTPLLGSGWSAAHLCDHGEGLIRVEQRRVVDPTLSVYEVAAFVNLTLSK